MDQQSPQPDKTIIVHPVFQSTPEAEAEDLLEFQDLVLSTGADIVDIITTKRVKPDVRTLIGSGIVEQIKQAVATHGADCVLFNHKLAPSQERNLEQIVKARVYDRTRVILDIFAQRAHTFEGKLQVELAQLNHLKTRLIRGWTHLERQKGGIGLRGPGETQLETDRRLINIRIKKLNANITKVRKQRNVARRARQKAEYPTLSLVGYTNAGKSSLFNRLTQSDIYVADQLFATLDPTLRKIMIPAVGQAILVDTVGFIRHLPHSLIDAFHATLEESKLADVLLHVADASDPDSALKIEQVNDVLTEIGADDIPQILIYNKIDIASHPTPSLKQDASTKRFTVRCSAKTGAGLELLFKALTEQLSGLQIQTELTLPPERGDLRSMLYRTGKILSETVDEQGNWIIEIKISKATLLKLQKQTPKADE